MSATTYESKITSSTSSAVSIFRVVSDLTYIDKVSHLIPEDKIRDIEAEHDSVRFKVDGLGQKVCIRIVDQEDCDFVKYGIENVPMEAYFWIQMKEVAPGDTRLKLTIRGEIPMMFRMMLEKKIKEGLDQGADMLAQMPFDQWV